MPLGCLCSTLTPGQNLRLCLKADPDLIILFSPSHPGLGGFGSQTQADGTWSNFSRLYYRAAVKSGSRATWSPGSWGHSNPQGQAGPAQRSGNWRSQALEASRAPVTETGVLSRGSQAQSCPTVEGKGLQGSWLRSLGVWPGRVWGLLWKGSTVR